MILNTNLGLDVCASVHNQIINPTTLFRKFLKKYKSKCLDGVAKFKNIVWVSERTTVNHFIRVGRVWTNITKAIFGHTANPVGGRTELEIMKLSSGRHGLRNKKSEKKHYKDMKEVLEFAAQIEKA